MKALTPLLVAVTLGLAGCSETQKPACSAVPADAVSGGSHPSLAAAPIRPLAGVVLALDPEGLRAVDPETGSTRLIAFDRPDTEVVVMVNRALGDGPGETGVNSDCGAGLLNFTSWDDGLTVWSQQGRFVGWAVNRHGLTTMGGIGVGSTRNHIDRTVVAEFSHGSLGKQFRAGDLHGVMHEGRVAHMWAGTSCNFG